MKKENVKNPLIDNIERVHTTEMEVVRATEEWQRAGAYYVRIQAMAKKHHLSSGKMGGREVIHEVTYTTI